MQKVRFDAGEQRHVKLKIHAAENAPFRIKSARWELCLGSDVRDTGECEIDEHIIDVYINPPEIKTSYTLRVAYEINDEKLVEQIELVVV